MEATCHESVGIDTRELGQSVGWYPFRFGKQGKDREQEGCLHVMQAFSDGAYVKENGRADLQKDLPMCEGGRIRGKLLRTCGAETTDWISHDGRGKTGCQVKEGIKTKQEQSRSDITHRQDDFSSSISTTTSPAN
jgi:hypothetical protein